MNDRSIDYNKLVSAPSLIDPAPLLNYTYYVPYSSKCLHFRAITQLASLGLMDGLRLKCRLKAKERVTFKICRHQLMNLIIM